MWFKALEMLYVFFKIGIVGFGGGYTMLSMIMTEAAKYAVTAEQLADLNALDMVVPGPIAINAATYVGYLYAGVLGSVAATVGVSLPSFIIAALLIRALKKWKESRGIEAVMTGIRPAAVGMIGAASMLIASGVLLSPGFTLPQVLSDPLHAVSYICIGIFALTAVLNIKFKVNPIALTAAAGIAGAIFLR